MYGSSTKRAEGLNVDREDFGLPCRIVDVFGVDDLSGNPVAIVHDADNLGADQMQNMARWMNHSETAFLSGPTLPDADYAVRIFSLEQELPFAGHPTLGACHAWLEAGGRGHSGGRVVQQCQTGLITLFYEKGRLEFVAPPLIRHEPPSDAELAEALKFLGSDGHGLIDAMWIDNGAGWLGLLFDRAETVLSLKPERSWPAALNIGVIGFHSRSSEFAVEIRTFFTDQHLAIVEDPATGSFNASVAQWLVETGQLPANYSTTQGTCIGRRTRIDVGAREGALTVSGRTRTVIRGTAFLV